MIRTLAALVAVVFALTVSAFAEAAPKGKKLKAAPPPAQQQEQTKVAQADQFLQVPEAATGSRWTGCWAGVNIGYATQTTEVGPVSFDAKDMTYGLGGGCDVQIKGTQLVMGLMADIDWTNANSAVASFSYSWFAGGRAGVLLSDTLLAYAVAGYTSLDGSTPAGVPFSADFKGLTLGAGLEAMVAKNWSLVAEYRNIDLGSDSLGGPFSADHSQQSVRFGARYRF